MLNLILSIIHNIKAREAFARANQHNDRVKEMLKEGSCTKSAAK